MCENVFSLSGGDWLTIYRRGPEANTVILLSRSPVSCVLPAPVAFLKLWFGIVILMLFLTSGAKTSIFEEGIESCWTPGAVHSAKMTRPLYGDGSCVELGGEFHDGDEV